MEPLCPPFFILLLNDVILVIFGRTFWLMSIFNIFFNFLPHYSDIIFIIIIDETKSKK